jgi:hypothetical protein
LAFFEYSIGFGFYTGQHHIAHIRSKEDKMKRALKRIKTLAVGILFFGTWLSICIAQKLDSPSTIIVPKAKAPAIDGVLSPGEWDMAHKIRVSESSQILVMHDGKYLYLGLSDTRQVIGSMLVDRGSKIEVLHSSAS